jgi:conjugal transfer pilus assembly protein TrbC
LVSAAVAQTVDGIDIGAIKTRSQAERKDAESFVADVLDREKSFEQDALEVRANGLAALASVRPEDLPMGAQGDVDFDALVAGAAANASAPEGSAPLFMVFVSLSMPRDALARLIADTTRAGGVVVFRGFPGNDAKAFVAGLKSVLTGPEQQAHIAIDPRLFRAFGVSAVPTYVAASSDFELCAGLNCTTAVPPYDRMTGNVTLEYALESFADNRGPGAAIAATALTRFRKLKP